MTGTAARPRPLLSQRAFITRDLTLLRRNRASLISMLIVPPLFLLCLWAVFGYAADQAPVPFNYLRFCLAGCLFQAAMFTAAASSMAVAHDIESGLIDRVRVLPGSAAAFLVGRVAVDLLRMLGSTAALLALALVLGLDAGAAELAWMVGWSLVAAVVLSAAANGWILTTRAPIAAAAAIQSFEMLLLLMSTAFIPAEAVSGGVRTLVAHMPLSPIIELIRAGGTAGLDGSGVAEAAAWLALLAIAGTLLVVRRFRGRRNP